MEKGKIAMILAVSIENTVISFGAFEEDGTLACSASIAARPRATADEYAAALGQILSLRGLGAGAFSGAAFSSVVPALTPVLKAAVGLLFPGAECMVVSAGVKTGLNLKVSTATLGSDFVCAAVCALEEFSPPCVIVSLGTATTFAVIDRGGVFRGTAISAGVEISAAALHQSAAQLPQIGLEPPQALIGTNTAAALRSGLVYGTASMIDGMCARFQDELDGPAVFLMTGQSAPAILPYCRTPFSHQPDLVLRGLCSLYRKNQKQ